MARFVVFLDVMPRSGVADPPGQAACSALLALGFAEVRDVRIGRRIAVELEAPDERQAAQRVRAMAEQLLANPVIEEFAVSLPGCGRSAEPGRRAEPAAEGGSR